MRRRIQEQTSEEDEEISSLEDPMISDRKRNEDVVQYESPPRFSTIKAKPAPKFSN